MKSSQLVKLLNKNERSQAWLARKLNLSAMAICKWCKEKSTIPERHVATIKRLLK